MKTSTLFNYRTLVAAGWAHFRTGRTDLLVTLRGLCMIDVFDMENQHHAAYMDFDTTRDIVLDSAYGSPVIGLPFPRPSAGCPLALQVPFGDLREKHSYGFYIEPAYRNKGEKGIWNLDALMVSIALEVTHEAGLRKFTLRPTEDTAPYYRCKYHAQMSQTTGSDRYMAIDLTGGKDQHAHLHRIIKDGKTHFFRVRTVPN